MSEKKVYETKVLYKEGDGSKISLIFFKKQTKSGQEIWSCEFLHLGKLHNIICTTDFKKALLVTFTKGENGELVKDSQSAQVNITLRKFPAKDDKPEGEALSISFPQDSISALLYKSQYADEDWKCPYYPVVQYYESKLETVDVDIDDLF